MLDQLSGSSRSSPQSTQRSSGGADETRVERKAMLNRKCSMFNRKKKIYIGQWRHEMKDMWSWIRIWQYDEIRKKLCQNEVCTTLNSHHFISKYCKVKLATFRVFYSHNISCLLKLPFCPGLSFFLQAYCLTRPVHEIDLF